MAAKVTFDHTTRTIKPKDPVTDTGSIQLDVQVDLYSDGKEDWLADTTLNKFYFPIEAIGGQPTAAGQLGTTYILTNGWRLSPNKNRTFTVPRDNVDGVFPIYGEGGLNESVKSGHQSFADRSIVPWAKVFVRKVGNPVDSLRVGFDDASEVEYGSALIAGENVATSFADHFVGFENAALIPYGTTLHFHVERTGARDETNYYEIGYVNNIFGAQAGTIVVSNGTEEPEVNVILMSTIHVEVPYTLNLVGNVYTDTGDPVALPATNVNVQQQVSTLVEVRTDETAAADLSLMRKILDNGLRTDPETGKLTLFDDDGVTPIRQWDIYEDVDGTQPYRGQGSERRDAPVEI